MKFNILTLFPDMFPGPLNYSIAGNALDNKKYSIKAYDIRDFSDSSNKSVDDTPFGGGSGMLLKPDVVASALDKNIKSKEKIIYLSPKG